MGADDCTTRNSADALADDSARLVAAKQHGELTPLDVDRAARMATEAAAAFAAERAHHEPAMGALVNLAAVLSGAGRLPELAGPALAALAHPTTWPARDDAWRDLVYNALLGAMDRSPPERVLPVLELARQGALLGEPRAGRFLALASATRDAGKALANVGRWDLHARLPAFVAPPALTLPPLPARALLDAQAAMAADAIVFCLSRRETARARELAASLRALLAEHADALVAAHHAVALECLLDANTPEPFIGPAELFALVDEAMELVSRWPAEREIARALTSAAGTMLVMLSAARDTARQGRAVELLAALTVRFPGDEELHFNSARAVVNAAIVRAGEIKPTTLWQRARRLFGPTDPMLDLMETTLKSLVSSCRNSPQLADARQRFERVTGRTLPPPRWSLPPPAPLHPDVERVRAAFQHIQATGANPADDAQITAVLGQGAQLPRVTLQSALVYRREERYFVSLMEEVARQAAADAQGYWKARQVQLEAITRRLIEDGTEPIAITAGSVRAFFRMPPLKRKPALTPEADPRASGEAPGHRH